MNNIDSLLQMSPRQAYLAMLEFLSNELELNRRMEVHLAGLVAEMEPTSTVRPRTREQSRLCRVRRKGHCTRVSIPVVDGLSTELSNAAPSSQQGRPIIAHRFSGGGH